MPPDYKKITVDQRNTLLELYGTLASCAGQVSLDIMKSEDRGRAICNFDFSALHYFIWRRSKNHSVYDRMSEKLCKKMISDPKILPFYAVITPFTFWEILDSCIKTLDNIKKNKSQFFDIHNQVVSRMQEYSSAPVSNLEVPVSQLAMRQAIEYLEDSCGARVPDSLDRVYRLFAVDGPFWGLKDMINDYTALLQIDSDEFGEVFDKMWSFRSPSDKKRSADEKEFRYHVDAANVLLSKMANEMLISQFSYVTKANYIDRFCKGFGRNPVSLFFWMNAKDFNDFPQSRDKVRFFEEMERECKFIHDEVFRRPVVYLDPDDYLIQRISAFASMTFDKVSGVEFSRAEREEKLSEISDLMSFGRAASVLDKNIAATEDGLKKIISDMKSIASDDIIEKTGLERTAYFQSLRKKVSLKGRR